MIRRLTFSKHIVSFRKILFFPVIRTTVYAPMRDFISAVPRARIVEHLPRLSYPNTSFECENVKIPRSNRSKKTCGLKCAWREINHFPFTSCTIILYHTNSSSVSICYRECPRLVNADSHREMSPKSLVYVDIFVCL